MCSTQGTLALTKIQRGNSQGKKHIGRTRRRWEGDIVMDFKYKIVEVVDWSRVVRGRDF
jgi:hypothetical protein